MYVPAVEYVTLTVDVAPEFIEPVFAAELSPAFKE